MNVSHTSVFLVSLLFLAAGDVRANDTACELTVDLDFWRKYLCLVKTNTRRIDYQYKEDAKRNVDACIDTETSRDTDSVFECQLKQDYLARTCQVVQQGDPDKIEQCLVEGFVTQPRSVVAVRPESPKSKKACEGGSVTVAFKILTTGEVREPRVINADPPKVFNRTAVTTIKRFKFAPQKRNHVAESSQFTWDFEFPASDSKSCQKWRKKQATST